MCLTFSPAHQAAGGIVCRPKRKDQFDADIIVASCSSFSTNHLQYRYTMDDFRVVSRRVLANKTPYNMHHYNKPHVQLLQQ